MTVEFGLDNELMQLLMKTRCEELLVVISFGHMVLYLVCGLDRLVQTNNEYLLLGQVLDLNVG
jgi:hypothetical protein